MHIYILQHWDNQLRLDVWEHFAIETNLMHKTFANEKTQISIVYH